MRHHLGLALGGRPAAAFATRLMMPVSNDTLLRVVRRHAHPRREPLIVAGIDDGAFRRNHRYGSIVVDLERRRIVALLADRERATVAAWLAAYPEISVLSRDHGGGYGEAKMIRKKNVGDLTIWLRDASKSLLASFAAGIASDEDAVRAAITEPWSNGQTEGQVNRLKLVKRQMYGRAKIDLLEARLIGAH